jgi:ribosomal-protein-alanine N-acetyltransferase
MLVKTSVCRWMVFGPNTPVETESYFLPLAEEIACKLREGRRPDTAVFTLRERNSGKFAGQCALLPINFSPGAYLIGYQLDDTVWGQGFGREAGRFLCHYGLNIMKSHRISGDCVAGNEGSEKIMLSLGFRREGIQKNLWHNKGLFYDNLLFGLSYGDLSGEELSALGRDFISLRG